MLSTSTHTSKIPEARTFKRDIKKEVARRRAELLAAALTIWRWGRKERELPFGRPLGSFETWCRWVRDPLIALGCKDPAERVGEAKWLDARRQAIAALFTLWWEKHADRPVAAHALHRQIKEAIDPQGRGRQFQASYLGKLAGTRLGGFVLTRQQPTGKWGAATFALRRNTDSDREAQ